MVDILSSFFGYQAAELQNQAMAQKIEQQKQLAPYIVEGTRLELEQAKSNMERQRIISQQLSTPATAMPSDVGMGDAADAERGMSLLGQAYNLQQMGSKVLPTDPKLGMQLLQEGRELHREARETQKQLLQQKKESYSQVANWANQINSQEALNNIRAEVDAQHPGQWDKMGLPTTYNKFSANVFRRIGLSTLDAYKQAETQIKIIESQTAADYFSARTESARQDAIKSRIDVEVKRNQLTKVKETDTVYDKYLAEAAKEKERYATDLSKRRIEILKDPKKFPTAVKEPTILQKASASLFGNALPESESAQKKALAMMEAEESVAHTSRMAAIESKYAAKGITLPKKGTPTPIISHMNKEQVMSKLRAANPNTSDADLEAYAISKGYLK